MRRSRISAPSLLRQLGTWRSTGGVSPAYRELADAMRLLVLDGRLPLDIGIPGERDLAAVADVSRTTVSAAYALLREDGFVTSSAGAPSRISLPGRSARNRPSSDGVSVSEAIDFSTAVLPANACVHAAYAKALLALPEHLPSHGYAPQGLDRLREVIADRYARSGLATDPEQILVTSGAQHALALVLRQFTRPGDAVLIDHPTYPLAIDAIDRVACAPLPVALGRDGWDIDALCGAIRRASPRVAYIVADHHNPTGHLMQAEQRLRLAEAACRCGTLLVFDETLIDFWVDGSPTEAATAVNSPEVVRLGSTAKSFWGGLRVGWVRADRSVVDALANARASLDLGTPILEQLAVAELLADDDQVLTLRRTEAAQRRHHLTGLLDRWLPDWHVWGSPGGLSIWVELPGAISTTLAASSSQYGLLLAAGPRFGVGGAFERFIRLPFTLPADELNEAVLRLARLSAATTQASGRIRPRPELNGRDAIL